MDQQNMTEPEWHPNPFRGQRVLNLGCGARPIRGAVNHDRVKHGEFVDVWCNLDAMPWRLEGDQEAIVCGLNGAYNVIIALDLFEHLVDPYGAVNECWNLLCPGGVLIIRVAAWDNPATFADMTHRHWANEEAYSFFDRTTRLGKFYGHYHPADSLGRLPTPWRIDGVDRVNPDERYGIGDLQFTMVKLAAHPVIA